MGRYHLECTACGATLDDFGKWIAAAHRCSCGSLLLEARYDDAWRDAEDAFARDRTRSGLWRYLDLLPVRDRRNVVSSGEGSVPIERWPCLEAFAAAHGIDCTVYAHRHDNNPSTGTFKDLSGSMVASVLKEAGVRDYVVASTGNIGVAFSRYLAAADIGLSAFIPEGSSPLHDAEIGMFGQKVFRVRGDYADAKRVAGDFAAANGFACSPSGFDPIRIEAKKTIGFEWIRHLIRRPTLYVQALSGGMGPLGISKGLRELAQAGLVDAQPRFYLVQSDRCSPMAEAWASAKASGFPEGWEEQYPILERPTTRIPTLATGKPGLYPLVGPLVKRTGGEIVAVAERHCPESARFVACETAVRIGPAAAVAVSGFLYAVKAGHVRTGDVVVVAIGEGIRRSPEFMLEMAWSSDVAEAAECGVSGRAAYRDALRARIYDLDFSPERPEATV